MGRHDVIRATIAGMGFLDLFRRRSDAGGVPTGNRPALPPVVRFDSPAELAERMDVWSNSVTGLGGRNSRSACNVFAAQPERNAWELDNLFEFNALAARIVNREPDDCVRMGFRVKNLDAADQVELDEYLASLEYASKIADAHRWARVYGGAAAFVQIEDGMEPIEPVDFRRIQAVNGLTVYDRHELLPLRFDTNPNSATAKEPVVFQVSSDGISFPVHRSRLLLFDGVRVTPRRRRENNGWGGSYLAQIWRALEQYDVAHSYLNEAITQLTQGILKLEGINAAMKRGSGKALAARLNGLKKAMSILGDVALDSSQNEGYEVHNRPVTGFKEASEIFRDALMGATGYPESILFGRTPGGLNSGANAGDWTTWNTYIAGQQEALYTPKTQWFLRIALSAAASPVAVDLPSRIGVVWNPLQEASDVEKADNLGKVATAGNTLLFAGAISEEELRGHRLVRSEFELSADDGKDAEAEGETGETEVELTVAPEPTAVEETPAETAAA